MNATDPPLRVACDAMCGGLARWLRMLGVDASYTPDIDDASLVRHSVAENRRVLSADVRLFDRRPFHSGELLGLQLPVGLRLREQVRFVVSQLAITPGLPRCTACNGELERVSRAEIADVVPARSLLMTREFFRCRSCRHVYWEGTHWRRIAAVTADLGRPTGE